MTYNEARAHRHDTARRLSEVQDEYHAAIIDERHRDAREAKRGMLALRRELDRIGGVLDRIAPEGWRNAQ